ncbi:MAG: hypothetical protein HYZ28_09655 [Myxococcales bacterium]|nr:hypothetical protein [Myxococcales bacterium]
MDVSGRALILSIRRSDPIPVKEEELESKPAGDGEALRCATALVASCRLPPATFDVARIQKALLELFRGGRYSPVQLGLVVMRALSELPEKEAVELAISLAASLPSLGCLGQRALVSMRELCAKGEPEEAEHALARLEAELASRRGCSLEVNGVRLWAEQVPEESVRLAVRKLEAMTSDRNLASALDGHTVALLAEGLQHEAELLSEYLAVPRESLLVLSEERLSVHLRRFGWADLAGWLAPLLALLALRPRAVAR